MIHLPFKERIIFIGQKWQDEYPDYIKGHMKLFRFTPNPDKLREQFKTLMECNYESFGCVNVNSMKAGENSVFTADWLAGGSLNSNVWNEEFESYMYNEGMLYSLYRYDANSIIRSNPLYLAFMKGDGSYIGDLIDCFGSKETFIELLANGKKAEITEQLITWLKSGGVNNDEYVELDNLLL